MAKPIGNMTSNLAAHDKVSRRVASKFESKSSLDALKHPQAQAKPAEKPKYKVRKKR